MKTWEQCCKEVGYDYHRNLEYPKIKYNYFAYKKGEVFGPFDSYDAAKKVSAIYEKVEDSESRRVFDQFAIEQRRVELLAIDLFEKEMRKDFSELNDKLYAVIYSNAWDIGHPNGYDSVYEYMETYTRFAKDIIKSI